MGNVSMPEIDMHQSWTPICLLPVESVAFLARFDSSLSLPKTKG